MDFWEQFHAVRRARLPIDSGLEALLRQVYQRERARHDARWRPHVHKRLPVSTIRFYNQTFAEVQDIANAVLRSRRVSAGVRRAANEAYGYRLGSRATLGELMAVDVFADKTLGFDVRPDFALAGLKRSEMPALVTSTQHFFLHRPQNTEQLFLHECIVGFLGNGLQNRGLIPSRAELPMAPMDYWVMPAYTIRLLAAWVGVSEAELVALHFQDNATAKRVLPRATQDVLLVAATLYLYLDTYSLLAPKAKAPALLLSSLFSFFVIPSIERFMEAPGLRLRRGAGRFIDTLFYGAFFGADRATRNDTDIARALTGLVDALWVSGRR